MAIPYPTSDILRNCLLINMNEKLKQVINHLLRRKGQRTDQEFIDFVVTQICLYGGDTTAQLLSHYGDNLKQQVTTIVTELSTQHKGNHANTRPIA